MATLDKFLIAPFKSGLERDVEPWLIPEDALETLEDSYIFRGKIRKRFGYSLIGADQYLSRLRVNIGSTDKFGGFVGVAPGAIFKIGQQFSVGTNIFTVNVLGTPAVLLSTGPGTGTFNTTTGAITIVGAPFLTPIYYYPLEPVMGLIIREVGTINQEEIFGFDTQFSYIRAGGGWERFDPAATGLWTGTNSDFFWGTNARGASLYDVNFYVTNYIRADRIRYIAQGAIAWTVLRPQLNAGATRFLDSCRIILPFKDRIIALNTLETEGANLRTYVNRCRFSQNGDPTAVATGWLDDTPGRGGYIDAPTPEAIISAQFLKDRLIVYFERSTWEIVYTGNEVLPFRWQQLNTELGSESTFSAINFDTAILGMGNVGIHACSGVNVDRIDQKIPDEVFKIHNGNDGPKRVYGIRDFYSEFVYWTFPSQETNPTFPNRVLVFNYENGAWAFLNDTFTCFGYYQSLDDASWATLPYPSWAAWESPWDTGAAQSLFLQIIAGNQEGWVVIIDRDKNTNSQFYSITDITAPNAFVVVDHNFSIGDYFLVENAQGITEFNGFVGSVETIAGNTVTLGFNPAIVPTGTYTGGGTLRRISNLNILTKRFNPYISKGQNFYLPYVDFYIQRATGGEITIDYFQNDSSYSIKDSSVAGVRLGNYILNLGRDLLNPLEAEQDKFWHRFYFDTEQFNIQLKLCLDDAQMRDLTISECGFMLHAMILTTELKGRLQ